jgi:hypothetical protein
MVSLFDLLYQYQMIDDDDDCGAIGGMQSDRGNRSTRRKPVPVPLCPPQIPHDLTRARTRAASVGNPATNRLSYVTAVLSTAKCINVSTDTPGSKVPGYRLQAQGSILGEDRNLSLAPHPDRLWSSTCYFPQGNYGWRMKAITRLHLARSLFVTIHEVYFYTPCKASWHSSTHRNNFIF